MSDPKDLLQRLASRLDILQLSEVPRWTNDFIEVVAIVAGEAKAAVMTRMAPLSNDAATRDFDFWKKQKRGQIKTLMEQVK